MKHRKTVDNDVFDAIRDGHRTATIGVYFPFVSQPACDGDIFVFFKLYSPSISPGIEEETIERKVARSARKRLHNLTDDDLKALGYPEMRFRNFDTLVYPSAVDWFKRMWDILNPFTRMKWKDNPMVLIHFLENETKASDSFKKVSARE